MKNTTSYRLSQVPFVIFPSIPPLIPRGKSIPLLSVSSDRLLASPLTDRLAFPFPRLTRLLIDSFSLRSACSSPPPLVEFVGWLQQYGLLLTTAPQTTSLTDISEDWHFSANQISKNFLARQSTTSNVLDVPFCHCKSRCCLIGANLMRLPRTIHSQ